MKYYNERNGLLEQKLHIDFERLKEFFLQTYRYFENKDYFECAIKGIWKQVSYNDSYMVEQPTFSPSVEIYFANKLQSTEVWPVFRWIENYDEVTLFTMIEILYDHIAFYDYEKEEIQKEEPRREYVEHINNLLRAYKDGFYLEPSSGFVMALPNQALRNQLSSSNKDIPDDVIEKLSSASKMYYRFDSSMEEKKKAINILADILEPIRTGVKDIFDKDHIGKRPHDKLIFDIVNNFNIRHNKDNQKTDYSKNIWYDWMMQYYTSVIIAYYKIQKDRELDLLF